MDLKSYITVEVYYHDSNSSWDENMSGRIKFNNDQSSAKLFCKGVPVNKSLFSTFKSLRSLTNLHLAFFNLCPFKNKEIKQLSKLFITKSQDPDAVTKTDMK